MREIYLEQGSPQWLAWRAGRAYVDTLGVRHEGLNGPRITATAGSVCGGHSPFATPHQLWGEMLGLRKREEANFVMARGSALEPKARKAYTDIVGEEYEALCIESEATPWIAASLDGIDLLRTRGVEIKCPISQAIHDMAMLGEVPNYYYDQIQWQMMASDNKLTEIDYFSYAPKIGVAQPITVRVDLVRQVELVEAAMKLRLAVMTRVPLSGSEFEQAGKAFLVLSRRLKALSADVDTAKERLKLLSDGKAMQGGGVSVIIANSSGRVNLDKVLAELVANHGVSQAIVDQLKNENKGKATVSVSIKEAGDADAIYAELVASGKTEETSVPVSVEDGVVQPHPVW